jgi:ketosteroid isomerase-like protein
MSPALQHDIAKTNRTFEEAVSSGDMSALDAVYTADARILPPATEMVSGRENIKQFWQAAITGLNVGSVKLETVEFNLVGDTGYEIGRATLNFAADGVPPMIAKYVVIWKQEDGVWKWHIDIWNPNA